MRKVVASEFVSLDGVVGSPERWQPPYWCSVRYIRRTRLYAIRDSNGKGRKRTLIVWYKGKR
jgi:hypothetical protein